MWRGHRLTSQRPFATEEPAGTEDRLVSGADVAILVALAALAIGLIFAPLLERAVGWTGIVLFLLCEARTRMLLAAVKRKVAAPERSSGEGAQGGHLPDEAVANCLRELTSRQNQLVVRLDALSRELTRARTVLINELPQWRSAIEQPISSRLLETDTRLSGKLDAGLEVMSQAQAKEVKERRGAVAQLESALGSTQHRLATEAAARAELTARVSEQSRTLIAVGKSVEGIGGRLDRGLAQLEGLSRTVGQAAQIAEERAERLVTAERSLDRLSISMEEETGRLRRLQSDVSAISALLDAERRRLGELTELQSRISERADENAALLSALSTAVDGYSAGASAVREALDLFRADAAADREKLIALDAAHAVLKSTQTRSTDELKMAMEARVAEIAALRDTVEALGVGAVADRQQLAALDSAQAALESIQTTSTDELKVAIEARIAETAAVRAALESLAAGTIADRQHLAALDNAQAALENTQTTSTDELKMAMEARVAEIAALRDTVETLAAGTVADRQRLAALDDAQAALESTQTKSTDELKVAMAARVAEIAGLRASLGSLAAETVADRQRLAGLENAQAALESTQTKSADEFKVATEARAAEIVPLRETVETLAARTAADRQRLAALDSAQAALKSTHTKSADELRVAMEARAAEIAALRASLESQATDAVADRQRLAGLENAQAVLESTQTRSTDALKVAMGVRARETVAVREMVEGLTTLVDADRQKFSALPAKLDQLSNSLAALRLQSVSLDLVSALRSVRLIWTQKSALKSMEEEIGVEHGHALLMAVLAEEERKSPGVLSGKTLIEIGTTRELWPNQGSTEKLAIFTAMTDMYFRTVDMDPANTRRAKEVIKYINPTARAITMKGEEYLSVYDSVIDYVYLDAFDCYHDNHSQQRKDRYRELLNTSITDETCWRMHADCAESLIEKMRIGGIIVIDDTWIDAEGTYTGKGKLAVPILEKSGFKIIAKIGTAIALRRPRKPNSQLK